MKYEPALHDRHTLGDKHVRHPSIQGSQLRVESDW